MRDRRQHKHPGPPNPRFENIRSKMGEQQYLAHHSLPHPDSLAKAPGFSDDARSPSARGGSAYPDLVYSAVSTSSSPIRRLSYKSALLPFLVHLPPHHVYSYCTHTYILSCPPIDSVLQLSRLLRLVSPDSNIVIWLPSPPPSFSQGHTLVSSSRDTAPGQYASGQL